MSPVVIHITNIPTYARTYKGLKRLRFEEVYQLYIWYNIIYYVYYTFIRYKRRRQSIEILSSFDVTKMYSVAVFSSENILYYTPPIP